MIESVDTLFITSSSRILPRSALDDNAMRGADMPRQTKETK